MTAWMCGLALAAASMLGGQSRSSNAPMAPIALYSGFEAGAAPSGQDRARRRTGFHHDAAGPALRVARPARRPDGRACRGTGRRLLQGVAATRPAWCGARPLPAPWAGRTFSDGSILPFSDVDCGGIRACSRPDLLVLPAAGRDAAFSALVRVLAHGVTTYSPTPRTTARLESGRKPTARAIFFAGNSVSKPGVEALKSGKAYGALEKPLVPRQ